MESDARDLASGTELMADMCIVGAGPAGLTLACQFMGSLRSVIILESGGYQPEARIQDLNAGTVDGGPYPGLDTTRRRQLGGSANLWNTGVGRALGGKFVPLDLRDLERSGQLSDWPFGYEQLVPFYQRAQAFLGLGPFHYDAEQWRADLGPEPAVDGPLEHGVYQYGVGTPLTQTYLRVLAQAGNIQICHHATATRLLTERGGRRISGVQAIGESGAQIRVRAKTVVLAAGAIENARLLLLSQESLALGESLHWVGRCFMEHPRDRSLTLTADSTESRVSLDFYRRRRSRAGVIVGGRISLSNRAVEAGYPSASVSIIPPPNHSPFDRVSKFVRHFSRRGSFPSLYRIVVNLEQRPQRENRIILDSQRDRLGLPRPILQWRWREAEHAGMVRLRTGLLQWLRGLGTIQMDPDVPLDPGAHHQAGTTRMHVDPSQGVVDPSGRVQGTDNLYVAGASLFPSSGWANPTLTIVAMSIRLADHLQREG